MKFHLSFEHVNFMSLVDKSIAHGILWALCALTTLCGPSYQGTHWCSLKWVFHNLRPPPNEAEQLDNVPPDKECCVHCGEEK